MKIEKLEVEIQKDLNKFKEEVAIGLTFKQLLHVIAGGVVSVALYISLTILKLYILRVIAIVIIATPIFVSGFFTYQGLTLIQFLRNILNFYRDGGAIIYKDDGFKSLQ